MSEYWYLTYHREYGEDYDEDGFAKELPADHPARIMMPFIDALFPIQPEVKIRKDYTEQFKSWLEDATWKPERLSVTTRDPLATNDLILEIDFYFVLDGQQWANKQLISYVGMRNQSEFDLAIKYALMDTARQINFDHQKRCEHVWPTHAGGGLPIEYARCEKCNVLHAHVFPPDWMNRR